MLTIDLHSCKLEQAMNIFTDYVNKSRLQSARHTIRFITGRGVIQEAYLLMAKDYDLDTIQDGYGILIVTFE